MKNGAKKIDHINMVVPNAKATVEWYTQNLGFEIIGHFMKNGFEIYYISNGTIVYEFFENPALGEAKIDHIAYASEDIKADYEYYKAKGVVLLSDINYIDFIWEKGAHFFMMQGPNGETIEVLQVVKS